MAFESLTNRLQNAFKKLRGKGKLTEKDIREGMREVRMALLEADVNIKVVKSFINRVTERAIGQEVLESLTPAQQIIKIVNEEMTTLMGESNVKIALSPKPPTVIMLAGLQGAGKTTTCAKLGGIFKKQNKRPLLVACDVYRPAAIKQLCVVGGQLDLPVFTIDGSKDPVDIATKAVSHAESNGNDIVIIDTAGRLHIDDELMLELQNICAAVDINEILLVVDSMTGQDAANIADSFNQQLEIGGVILTKFDGDARGGAALSVREVTGKPIKYVTTGEKLADIEPFYPERIATRILGMGDMLSLIEKAEQAFSEKKSKEMEAKLRKNKFTLTDFLEQLDQVKQMGPLQNIIDMLPGANTKALAGAEIDEGKMRRMEAIVLSMTVQERENPHIINSSRKKRIASGSGTRIQDVNQLLKQFDQMNMMIKQMSGELKGGKLAKRGLFGKLKQ